MFRRDGCPVSVLTGPKGRIFSFVWTDGKPETCVRFQIRILSCLLSRRAPDFGFFAGHHFW